LICLRAKQLVIFLHV